MSVVTFDFDDTLLWKRVIRDADGEIEDVETVGPNPEGLALLRQAIEDEDEVHIVTTRPERLRAETEGWLRKWGVLDGILTVNFTNGRLKRNMLEILGSQVHHDDDEEELENLPAGCRGVQLFPHPSWSQTPAIDESAGVLSASRQHFRFQFPCDGLKELGRRGGTLKRSLDSERTPAQIFLYSIGGDIMRITERKLRQIIREESARIQEGMPRDTGGWRRAPKAGSLSTAVTKFVKYIEESGFDGEAINEVEDFLDGEPLNALSPLYLTEDELNAVMDNRASARKMMYARLDKSSPGWMS